jgi:hypothetical protein
MSNNDYKSSNKVSSGASSGAGQPLQLFQPGNIILSFVFYSPIILVTCITGLSFVFQNFKGFIYLGFLIASCVIRNFIYKSNGSEETVNDRTICTTIQYGKYGNPTFSAFVFAFTIMYLSLPMFSNSDVNFWIFIVLFVYALTDIFIRVYKGCILNMGDLFLNLLFGLVSAAAIVSLMYAGGSGKYLFFNEVSSDKEVCSQPKKQTFKCSLYKNGELISGIN